ncbi:DoxX family protein [Belliella marina]|uniref:DoxX family protein n=1 Tax=Belliella marina TaxID=1644146 RepID=A0ABW4VT69_9BACT
MIKKIAMTAILKTSKTLNIILWIAQGLLALTFLWAGFMKIFQPEELPFPWIKDNLGLVLATGLVDLLAGVGIVFPALLRIQPKLTIYAAYGILTLMIAASIFHVSRGEASDIGFNIIMALLAVLVAWGRQGKVPISSKNE